MIYAYHVMSMRIFPCGVYMRKGLKSKLRPTQGEAIPKIGRKMSAKKIS